MADISTPNEPAAKVESAVDDQNAPQKNDGELQSGLETMVKGPGTPPAKGKTEEERKESRERLKTVFIILAFIVSCLALGLSYLSYSTSKRAAAAAERSAGAAIQSVDIARRSLEVSTRPWINISGTKLQSDFVPDVPPLFETLLENVGKTPAQNVTAHFAIGAFKKCVCSTGSRKEEFGSLAPGAKRSISANMTPETSDVVEQVRQGNLTINLCVEIVYGDDFSRHRRTMANLYARPGEGRKFIICPSGNSME